MVLAISVWQPIASIVIMQPEISSAFNSCGMAVISFDFSSTLTCPNTKWLAQAQALTMSIAPLPIPRSCERRNTFPSIAMTCPPISSLATLTQFMKQVRNSIGSIRANTRLKVSCDGMPFGNSKNVSNHSCFALPNSSTSSQLSQLQIAPQIAITKMSISLCSLVRSIRGSVILPKCSPMSATTAFFKIYLPRVLTRDDKPCLITLSSPI